jgi:hypothetical protein
VKKITFPGHPEYNRHKIAVLPQNARFSIKGTGPCQVKEAGAITPVQWQWLRGDAQYLGELQFNGKSYVTFKGERRGKSVGVSLNSEGLPAVYMRDGGRFSLEMHFTSYAEKQADSKVFEVPEDCPAYVGPKLDYIENVDNSSVSSPLALAQVLAKAKEICTCGCPYVYGGNGPCCGGGKSGYDCSGMTTKAYATGGWNIPRTAAGQQNSGRACSGGEQAGDLLFFGNPAYHVVMSVGGGQIAECPDVGKNCRITASRAHNGGCRRIV